MLPCPRQRILLPSPSFQEFNASFCFFAGSRIQQLLLLPPTLLLPPPPPPLLLLPRLSLPHPAAPLRTPAAGGAVGQGLGEVLEMEAPTVPRPSFVSAGWEKAEREGAGSPCNCLCCLHESFPSAQLGLPAQENSKNPFVKHVQGVSSLRAGCRRNRIPPDECGCSSAAALVLFLQLPAVSDSLLSPRVLFPLQLASAASPGWATLGWARPTSWSSSSRCRGS